jgi:hypothetical protein
MYDLSSDCRMHKDADRLRTEKLTELGSRGVFLGSQSRAVSSDCVLERTSAIVELRAINLRV